MAGSKTERRMTWSRNCTVKPFLMTRWKAMLREFQVCVLRSLSFGPD